jgi:hypothetical protein
LAQASSQKAHLQAEIESLRDALKNKEAAEGESSDQVKTLTQRVAQLTAVEKENDEKLAALMTSLSSVETVA